MGKVKSFYDEHFDELSENKKFHYATRVKNFTYLNSHKPTTKISEILKDNDFSKVNFFEKRKKFFQKYKNLFAIESALVRINHMKNLYNEDLSEDFTDELNPSSLYDMVDEMILDDEAIKTLSTYAVNVISLTETIFPRNKNQLKDLAQKSLDYDGEPILLAYLYTHIIICATDFYYHEIAPENLEIMHKILDKTEAIIEENYDEITMDLKLEFLVCAKLLNESKEELREKINKECDEILEKSPYITDDRKPKRLNTIDGAEHRNVLYIMSGLDRK